ncbi:hypothetical protein CYLTODRAFT_363228 [Cylindrobasidium torrendii FP15055 ss-10]|uniref:DNA 3'-5' helicase n=1 Tax=Cylindrobasidium torrendii FP15055 ss-10 TaxID=1314674 RepID=A0A0D7AS22_9AGAR|nr:hypothetical protein CYLTODRAFT_363228 [Cylindrobasidium torrendii FP15055 ss-10]
MGLSAVAVNGQSWSAELDKDIRARKYRAILAGPEMLQEHEPFRAAIREVMADIIALIVDEAHCISQWGGEFRPLCALLDRARSLLLTGVPVLAASATMTPTVRKEVMSKLNMSSDSCFFLGLGNDRPNIYTSVHRIKSTTDFEAHNDILHLDTVNDPRTLPKTIIFMDSPGQRSSVDATAIPETI